MAWYTVKTYYKKSCEQHEHFYNRNIKGASVIVKDGFRFAEFRVETGDDKFPEFNFTNCPGGSADLDSVDLFSCFGDNVEQTEMVEMFDGGCWGDIEYKGLTEDEVFKIQDLIEEEGSYAIEDDGEWYLSDTECWVWGPLEVTDENGNVRIIVADENGNAVDFKTDEPVVEEVTEQELLDDLEALKAEFDELMDSMPLPTEEKSVVTDWYPVEINPVRNGTYQVIESELEEKWPFPSNVKAAVWDGTKWDNTEVVMWRGLTEEVK